MQTIKPIIGYAPGVFDLFHIGHLNILRNAKSMCDFLIVGVTIDEAVMLHKNKKPIIPFEERIEIVRNIKYVDLAVPQEDYNDKLTLCKQLKVDRVFVGGWYETEKWKRIEIDLKQNGIDVFYFPYTKNISSTMINELLKEKWTDVSKQELEEIKKEQERKEHAFPMQFKHNQLIPTNFLDEKRQETFQESKNEFKK